MDAGQRAGNLRSRPGSARDQPAKFSGHGSAIAQVYNHMIMPLANRRDKQTQIIWGIKDFESRFKRKPEGMWLAETAVDLESLDLMSETGDQVYGIGTPPGQTPARTLSAGKEKLQPQHFWWLRDTVCAAIPGQQFLVFFQQRLLAGFFSQGAGLLRRRHGVLKSPRLRVGCRQRAHAWFLP